MYVNLYTKPILSLHVFVSNQSFSVREFSHYFIAMHFEIQNALTSLRVKKENKIKYRHDMTWHA